MIRTYIDTEVIKKNMNDAIKREVETQLEKIKKQALADLNQELVRISQQAGDAIRVEMAQRALDKPYPHFEIAVSCYFVGAEDDKNEIP